ncbi:uncharacterized protein LOC132748749 [Ruditapes philippinarum]|uniref:uncharacterized protein LOC132748749 n=1 Tax=Ruditapes philippinarum TaxID=129788 RepID=UPI00295A6554|nr:uncharacterized protein LOC132748749 [Ruditapes philippinarum]
MEYNSYKTDMKVALQKYLERTILFVLCMCVMCLLIQNSLLQQSRTGYLIIHQNGESFRVRSRKYLETDTLTNSGQHLAYKRSDEDDNLTTTQSPFQDTLLQWRQYEREALAVFILSAIGSNSTTKGGYKREIKLNGWEAMKHRLASIKCCVLWNTDKFSYFKDPEKIFWKSSRLAATQFTCPIRGPLVDVRGVTLEFRKKPCPRDESVYVKPFLPKLQPKESFAICVKIVYGVVDMKLLVDWMEYYREMKVDKVFMFTYNLTRNIETVLQHYTNTGFLERRHFDFPWKKDGLMKREIGVKMPSVWQDEQVVVFDCYQRLQGYTYISIIDLDEFLLPRKHSNIKKMMNDITRQYPKAAGFTLKSFIFAKDWNKTVATSGSDIVQYLRRTPALYTRQKNILIPGRVQPKSLDTHEFEPETGYERIKLPESTAALNHYRTCYSDFRKLCRNKKKRIFDKAILNVVDRFRNRTLWINDVGIS